jgi:hypothetical protein
MTEVCEMGAQEDAALVRRGYEAFSAGDMDTLGELFTEDAVWHTGGSGGLSGDKQGRDAILAYFGELASRSNGSLKVTLEDVATGDRSRKVGISQPPPPPSLTGQSEDWVAATFTRPGRSCPAMPRGSSQNLQIQNAIFPRKDLLKSLVWTLCLRMHWRELLKLSARL